jgi:hypothetical protein
MLWGFAKPLPCLRTSQEVLGPWFSHVYDNEGNEEFFDQHQTNKSDSLLHLPAARSNKKPEADSTTHLVMMMTNDETAGEKAKHANTKPNDPVANAGYIVYKDQKTVVFYLNDLASMPPKWFCLGNDRQDCVDCVHGLAPLTCWTDDSVMNWEMFLAPAPVVAYNMLCTLLIAWTKEDSQLHA